MKTALPTWMDSVCYQQWLSSVQFSCGIWPPSSLTQFLNWQSIISVKPRSEYRKNPSTHQKLNPCFLSTHQKWNALDFKKPFANTSKLSPLCESSVCPAWAQGMSPCLGWVRCDVDLECEVKQSSGVQGSQTVPTPKSPTYCLIMLRSVHFSTSLFLLANT